MKKIPYLSVVIPAYNASGTLPKLLASLNRSKYKDFEVIVGDDGSGDKLKIITVNGKMKKKGKITLFSLHFSVCIVRLRRNRGPAAARNAAAKKARGTILVFLDSDVEVYPDTLGTIAKRFSKDPDLTALTGVWDKEQHTNNFFPQFKALRDWSYWTNERDHNGYYYLFSTRIAAIKRDVFVRLRGFNEAFRQMEDVELTYRIVRRYAIIFDPAVRVHHEFEGFIPVARKYFWRSFYWTRLWGARKKFDPVATTMWETFSALSGVSALLLCCLGLLFMIFSSITNNQYPITNQFTICNLQFAILLFFIHLFLLRRFLLFVYREKGIVFAAQSLVVGLVLYSVIIMGAIYFKVDDWRRAHHYKHEIRVR